MSLRLASFFNIMQTASCPPLVQLMRRWNKKVYWHKVMHVPNTGLLDIQLKMSVLVAAWYVMCRICAVMYANHVGCG
jgi:hypothetical protein